MSEETHQKFYDILEFCLQCLYQKVLLNLRLGISEIQCAVVKQIAL